MSGAKVRTIAANPHQAASSAQNSMAPATPTGGPPTTAAPVAISGGAIPRWTPSMAREILSQSVIAARAAGIDIRVYESTRGSVVVELMGHRIIDGLILPAGDTQ